jgi:hypothetical protein
LRLFLIIQLPMPLAPKTISDLQQTGARRIRTKRHLRFPVLTVFLTLTNFVSANLAAAENPPEFLWANTMEGTGKECLGMTADQFGNIYVTGTMGFKQHQSIGTHGWSRSGGEVFLAKFNTVGKLLWLQKAGGDGTDMGLAVAVDEMGDAYVTGYFARTITFGDIKLKANENKETRRFLPSDMFIAKYDSTGKPLWARQAGGPALDQSYGIATDKSGNAYVTGYFQGRATFGSTTLQSRSQPDRDRELDPDYGDFFVAKYDASGNILWVRQAGEGRKNAGYGIAADSTGNVYLTGRFAGNKRVNTVRFGDITVTSTNLSAFIAKYDTDGRVLWAQPTAGDQYYHRNQIAVDGTGHAFIAGSFRFDEEFGTLAGIKSSGRNSDIFLVKYDTNGKILWCKQAGGQAVEFYALALDQDGNASVIGVFEEAAIFDQIQIQAKPHDPQISGYEPFLARYNSAGDAVWVKSIDRNVGLQCLALDKKGAACLTGNFNLPITLDHIKLEPPANLLKEQLFDRPMTGFIAKLRYK